MGADSADPSRSSGRRDCSDSDLEEGEFVASDDESAGSDGDSRSLVQHRHSSGGGEDARPEMKGSRLEGVVVDGGAPPSSTTPSRERDSDGTISYLEEGGFVASNDDSVGSAEDSHSVVQHRHGGGGDDDARPEIEPRRLEGVVVDGRAQPSPTPWRERDSDGTISDAVDADAGAASLAQGPRSFPCPLSREESRSVWAAHGHTRVHDPNGLEQGNKERTPPAISGGGCAVTAERSPVQRRPVPLDGQEAVDASLAQFVEHSRAARQVVARDPSLPPPARDQEGFWLCRVKGCGRRFATGGGLGGHMAGSRHGPGVFTSGSKLGGHTRTHPGKVTPEKRRPEPKVSAPELASALALPLTMPPDAMEVAPAQPAVAMSVPPGVLRLFGVNIVPGEPPASAAEEASSTVTETDQTSSASTNIEQ